MPIVYIGFDMRVSGIELQTMAEAEALRVTILAYLRHLIPTEFALEDDIVVEIAEHAGEVPDCPGCTEAAADRAERAAPVALQHMAVAEDGVLRWMSGRKVQNCELYAMPDWGVAPPLYAAPLADRAERADAGPLEALQEELRLTREANISVVRRLQEEINSLKAKNDLARKDWADAMQDRDRMHERENDAADAYAAASGGYRHGL